jgi:hypothetical protein
MRCVVVVFRFWVLGAGRVDRFRLSWILAPLGLISFGEGEKGDETHRCFKSGAYGDLTCLHALISLPVVFNFLYFPRIPYISG